MSDLRKSAEMALEVMSKEPESFTLWVEDMRQAREALRQTLAQPEQEPVAWLCESNDYGVWKSSVVLNKIDSPAFRNFVPLYTAPPKREWIDLTEDEAFACRGLYFFDTYKNINDKLKEKNT